MIFSVVFTGIESKRSKVTSKQGKWLRAELNEEHFGRINETLIRFQDAETTYSVLQADYERFSLLFYPQWEHFHEDLGVKERRQAI